MQALSYACEETAMNRYEAICWILSVYSAHSLSQTKNFADFVIATLHVGHVSLAAINRKLVETHTAKHEIKRTCRFCVNLFVTISDAMHGVIHPVCKRHKKPLFVAMDWADTGYQRFLIMSGNCRSWEGIRCNDSR
jgi:hypothetical protein